MSSMFESRLRAVLLFGLLPIAETCIAGAPRLVRDINPITAGISSNPTSLSDQGTWALFFANDGIHNSQAWITDGSTTGTFPWGQVASGSNPSSLPSIRVGAKTFLLDPLPGGSSTLWISDGTSAGTRSLGDATGDANWTNAALVGALGSKLIFSAGSLSNGARELWLSDGSGAAPVHVPSASGEGYVLANAIVVGSRIYLLALNLSTNAYEPWISDGTAAGTMRLASFSAAGNALGANAAMVQVGSYILFAASSGTSGLELWRIDTNSNAVSIVTDLAPGALSGVAPYPHFGGLSSKAVFVGSGDGANYSLWSTDGTAAGTVNIAPVLPDAGRLHSFYGAAPAARIIFWVPQNGVDALWATDGTAGGTAPLSISGVISDSEQQAGSRYYVAVATGSTTQIWRTDGTAAGTSVLPGISTTLSGGYPGIAGDDNKVFIRGRDSTGKAGTLDVYSVARDATARILNFTRSNSTLGASGIFGFAQGRLYFDNEDAATGLEPWISDGTVGGTHILKNIAPETQTRASSPSEFAEFNGRLFFSADDGTHGRELWQSDGTETGTQLAADINPGPSDSNPSDLFSANGKLYLFATDGGGVFKLFQSDGTAAGTAPLATVAPRPPPRFVGCDSKGVAVGSQIYFPGYDRTLGMQLWVTDGTSAGTRRLTNITFGNELSRDICYLVAFNGRVYFRAGNSPSILWASDGTSQGTGPVLDAGGNSIVPSIGIVPVSTQLYFANFAMNSAGTLWSSDGSASGTGPSNVLTTSAVTTVFSAIGGRVVAKIGSQIWTTDGTPSGAIQISPLLYAPEFFVNGVVAYSAGQTLPVTAPTSEVWASNGTASGTQRILLIDHLTAELVPGTFSNFRGQTIFQVRGINSIIDLRRTNGTPQRTLVTGAVSVGSSWGAAGQNFYYVGNDGTTGAELWAFSNDPPVVVNDDLGSVTAGQSVSMNVLANDSDSDGTLAPQTLTIVTAPTHGQASVGAAGQVTYTPQSGFTGSDSFTYTVQDDQGLVSPPATVIVSVVAATTSGGSSGGGKGGGGGAFSLLEILLMTLAAAVLQFVHPRRADANQGNMR